MNTEVDKVVENIDRIRDQYKTRDAWQNGDRMSTDLGMLSTCNTFLAEIIPQLEYEQDQKELEYKNCREELFIKYSDELDPKNGKFYTVDKVKALAGTNEDVVRMIDEYQQLKYKYRYLSMKRVDTNNLIDAMRSKVSYLKTEREKA